MKVQTNKNMKRTYVLSFKPSCVDVNHVPLAPYIFLSLEQDNFSISLHKYARLSSKVVENSLKLNFLTVSKKTLTLKFKHLSYMPL